MNNFKVLKLSSDPEKLEIELNRVSVGWYLIQLIPVTIQNFNPITNNPEFKSCFYGVFNRSVDEYENKD